MKNNDELILAPKMCASLLVLAQCVAAITCLGFVLNSDEDPSLQIQLPDGLIRGRLRRTVDTDTPYYSYEGIPYARPPVGALRFKAPQPPDKWEGVLDADGSVPICYQLLPFLPLSKTVESEDCLYLHVYVPKPSPESNQSKAVMVWIYGGGFQLGFATSGFYGPDYLIEQDVILVAFNYRLNVFGFLASGDLESPGNYGLKDQHAALEWVKNNIRLFGGDPDRITIFGESAGGASVQYHLLSPRSRGLFNSAISQSGSAICPWALQTKPKHLASQAATLGGFFGRSTKSLIAFLRKIGAEQLRNLALQTTLLNFPMIFAPVTEPEHRDAFFTESAYVRLEEKRFEKVPYIVGFNSEETGLILAGLEVVKSFLELLPVPSEIFIPPGLNNRDPTVGNKIREYYFKDKSKSISTQYIQFFSDTNFYRSIIESARLHSIVAPTYVYRFAYRGYYLGRKAFINQEKNSNFTTHAEELWYIFSRKDLKQANDTDRLTRKRMVTLWTNFAKYGNATPKQTSLFENVIWRPYQQGDSAYLDIDTDVTMKSNFKAETTQFWKDIFDKYGNPPFYTY